MYQRLAGALVVCLLVLLGAVAGPAGATEAPAETDVEEEGGNPADINSIGTQNEVSRQFLPEEAEPPAFFRFMYYPLVIAGVVVSLLLLAGYLLWQPRFAEERRSRRRR